MTISSTDSYIVYARTYGKVSSGAALTDKDYGENKQYFEPYSADGQVAVAMGAQDVKAGKPMRSKTDFVTELRRLTA